MKSGSAIASPAAPACLGPTRPSSGWGRAWDSRRISTPVQENSNGMSTATAPATDPHAKTMATLARRFGDGVFSTSRFRDNLRLHVPPERLIDVLTVLKTSCGFHL